MGCVIMQQLGHLVARLGLIARGDVDFCALSEQRAHRLQADPRIATRNESDLGESSDLHAPFGWAYCSQTIPAVDFS